MAGAEPSGGRAVGQAADAVVFSGQIIVALTPPVDGSSGTQVMGTTTRGSTWALAGACLLVVEPGGDQQLRQRGNSPAAGTTKFTKQQVSWNSPAAGTTNWVSREDRVSDT